MKWLLCLLGFHKHYKKRTDCYTILHYCRYCDFVAWETNYLPSYNHRTDFIGNYVSPDETKYHGESK